MWRKNSVPPRQSSGRLRYRIPDQCEESTCTFARPTSLASVIRNFACDCVGGIGLSGSPTSRDTASVRSERAHVCTPVTNAHLVCRLLLEKKKYIRNTTHTRTKM